MNRRQGVSDTLYLPLASRIYVSRRFPHYFYDEKALSLEYLLGEDAIMEKTGEYTHLASVARYRIMDEMVRKFLEKNGTCEVVNLGAGLETQRFRMRDERIRFLEVDLPEVIEKRREVLGEAPGEKLLGEDVFSTKWYSQIPGDRPLLFTASGLFQYFHEEEVGGLLLRLKENFPRGEILFDATNEKGIAYARRYVEKTGNKEAAMYFYVEDPKEFQRKYGLHLREVRTFFTEARRELKGLKLYTKIAMAVVDHGGRARVFRYGF